MPTLPLVRIERCSLPPPDAASKMEKRPSVPFEIDQVEVPMFTVPAQSAFHLAAEEPRSKEPRLLVMVPLGMMAPADVMPLVSMLNAAEEEVAE